MGRSKAQTVKRRKKCRPAPAPWTAAQTAKLKKLYAYIPNDELARLLGHPKHSVIVYANSFGLKKSKAFMSALRSSH